jgi:hypothetical protein
MSQMIFKKMNDVMKEIGSVGKNQKNAAQGFKFRGVDDLVNALHPALCKHGVFLAPRCVKEEHEIKEIARSSGKIGVDKHVSILMEYDFYAEDGSKVTIGPIAAEGLDSGDKATNKALSAALKYCFIQTFCVPTEDMAEADLETPTIAASSTPATNLINSAAEVKATPPAPVTQIAASKPTGGFKPPRSASAPAPVAVAKPVAATGDGW